MLLLTTGGAQVHHLLTAYLGRFTVAPALSSEEVEHWLVPRANVVKAALKRTGDL